VSVVIPKVCAQRRKLKIFSDWRTYLCTANQSPSGLNFQVPTVVCSLNQIVQDPPLTLKHTAIKQAWFKSSNTELPQQPPHGPRSIFPHRNIYNLHPYTELFRSHHCKPVRPSPCARLLSGSPIIEIGDLWFPDPLAMMSVDFAALKT
jgi:hypothetical protein